MGPTLGPESPSGIPSHDQGSNAMRYSALCGAGSSDEGVSSRQALTRTLSSSSIPFDDDEVDVVRVEGLRHADMRLEAR